MEEKLRRNIHSQLSDPEPLSACRTELTGTNSDSSAITLDTCKDFSHLCAAPCPDQTTKWTDQQHSLYLNSLEASFINQLHCSMHLRGWSLQSNSKRPVQNSLMSGQFLVLQDGCWKNVCLEKNGPMLESTADSHNFVGGSLRRDLASERSSAMRESDVHDHSMHFGEEIDRREGSSRQHTSSEKQSVCQSHRLESFGITAEVTDQNFKDEGQGASSSNAPMSKRLRTVTADDSSNDQVVPFGKFHRTGVSTGTHPSAEYTDKNELLSELPESFHFPRADLHYFLRGS
ncbi:hypothetical protein L6164_035676 [Bauhinia variegata]|uniref:Uncharacterized protein n=1 Tax=Bauhinia variegata TaxID=167791 RepID=A0ACB9KES2_BAUVA|nr:hypothetical protein L6164_035676 [Bauhinia variegata]